MPPEQSRAERAFAFACNARTSPRYCSSIGFTYLQSGPMRGERPHVRGLLDELIDGLAGPVPRSGLDAQEVRASADLRGLERRDVLE